MLVPLWLHIPAGWHRIRRRSFLSLALGVLASPNHVSDHPSMFFPKQVVLSQHVSTLSWMITAQGWSAQSSTTRWCQRTTLTFRASPHENFHVKVCQSIFKSHCCLVMSCQPVSIWGYLRKFEGSPAPEHSCTVEIRGDHFSITKISICFNRNTRPFAKHRK